MDNEAGQADEPDENVLELPTRLDLAAAETLCHSLRHHLLAGRPLLLAGGMVERVSTPGLQVLLAAAAEARARGLAFDLLAPSPALADALTDLGLWPHLPPSADGGPP